MVAACKQLKELTLRGSSPAGWKLADRLLDAAPGTEILTCAGGYVPRILPLNLYSLELDTSLDDSNRSEAIPDAFFQLLPSLPCLACLWLDLGFTAKLCSSLTMPRELETFNIGFCVNDHSPMQLEWLGRQACWGMDITIWFYTSKPSQHQTVVQMLQQLGADACVTVVMEVPFTETLQRIWAQLTDAASLRLELQCPPGLDPWLHVLPRCSALGVVIVGVQHIAWASFKPTANRILICLGPSAELHVHDCPATVVVSTKWPGQLHITGFCHRMDPCQVVGLPVPPTLESPHSLSYYINISKSGGTAASG